MALTQSKLDGNIPDRNTKSEINTLLNVVKSINDMNSKIVVFHGTPKPHEVKDTWVKENWK